MLFSLIPLFLKVSQVYRDSSIGNSINIVVVKIALLESNQVGTKLKWKNHWILFYVKQDLGF